MSCVCSEGRLGLGAGKHCTACEACKISRKTKTSLER